jgi:hypothetical protein
MPDEGYDTSKDALRKCTYSSSRLFLVIQSGNYSSYRHTVEPYHQCNALHEYRHIPH